MGDLRGQNVHIPVVTRNIASQNSVFWVDVPVITRTGVGRRQYIWLVKNIISSVAEVTPTGPTVSVWDGTVENPADVTVWNGTTELESVVEVT